MYQEYWLYIVALLVSIPAGVLGSFLLVRKSLMVGDAISHSVLPGLVVGFLIIKDLYSPILMVFATAVGVLTVVIIDWLYKNSKIKKDASIGITYTFLFALGVILLANFTSGNIDLDQECILYGDMGSVPLNLWFLENGFNLGPKAVWILGVVNLLVILMIFLGWRPITVSSFDLTLAQTMGLKPRLWNFILMSLVSAVIVTAFDIVGAILIVSLLATPASTSFLFGTTIKNYLLLTIIISLLSSILGVFIALKFDLILSGTLATLQGAIFLLAFVFKQINKTIKIV